MKGLKKAAAFITALALIASIGSTVSATTYDPYYVYENWKNGVDVTQDADNGKDEPESEETKDTNEEQSSNDNEYSEAVQASIIKFYSYKSKVTVGSEFYARYKLTPSKAVDPVTFTTSSKKVAAVDDDGKITAVGAGTAIITVITESGKKDRFVLTVTEPEETENNTDVPENTESENTSSAADDSSDSSVKAKYMELESYSVTLYPGDTHQIRYELTPKNSTGEVTFRSLKKSIATVSEDGIVTAKKPGTAKISCQLKGGRSISFIVTVAKEEDDKDFMEYLETLEPEYNEYGQRVPSAVFFDDKSTSIKKGKTIELNSNVYPEKCVYTLTYSSSDEEIAKVSADGKVTGLKAGNAVITVSSDNGKTDEISITVYDSVIKGIDVSKWNGDINWKKISKSNMVQFAMIRASYGYEDIDPKLDENVKGCEKYDIPYGFYHYTYARNVNEARKEAAYFLNAIEGYSPEYPVVLDIEEDFYKHMSKKQVTEIVTTFMEALEDAGYFAMIYSYAKFFDDNLYMDQIKDYDIWVACWGDADKLAENYSYHYGMWQYSETGKIDGIDEYVDLNYLYKDYRTRILKNGLNNLE